LESRRGEDKYRGLSTAAGKTAAFGRDDVCLGGLEKSNSKGRKQISPLRREMTNKGAGKSNGNGKSYGNGNSNGKP
jgi:hypothetical protein